VHETASEIEPHRIELVVQQLVTAFGRRQFVVRLGLSPVDGVGCSRNNLRHVDGLPFERVLMTRKGNSPKCPPSCVKYFTVARPDSNGIAAP
jgi:hypothetical protein